MDDRRISRRLLEGKVKRKLPLRKPQWKAKLLVGRFPEMKDAVGRL